MVFETTSDVKSSKQNNLWVAYYFRDFMFDEWEECLYEKKSLSPLYSVASKSHSAYH